MGGIEKREREAKMGGLDESGDNGMLREPARAPPKPGAKGQRSKALSDGIAAVI